MFFPCAQQFLLCWNPHIWWYSKLPSLLMRPPDVWSVRGFNFHETDRSWPQNGKGECHLWNHKLDWLVV
jgi:hypothetical protein